jgi:plasmid stabilization system protein ParE
VSTAIFIIRPGAAADLEGIEEYLAENASVEVAAYFLDTATAAFRLLASQPMMGRRLESLLPRLEDVRVWPLQIHRGYLIFYQPLTGEHGIEVLHVFDGARDIPRLIDDEF